MTDEQLSRLSVRELRDYKDQIESAIRAAIRERADAKSRMATPTAARPTTVDLERERDAWLAARRKAPRPMT